MGDVHDVLGERLDWLRRLVGNQAVQTNEVQRSWGLLPAFLLLSREVGRPLDLLELGPAEASTSFGIGIATAMAESAGGRWTHPSSCEATCGGPSPQSCSTFIPRS